MTSIIPDCQHLSPLTVAERIQGDLAEYFAITTDPKKTRTPSLFSVHQQPERVSAAEPCMMCPAIQT